MRKINWIVVHCSDSDVPAHDNIEVVRGWHKNERNFSEIGYHYFITKDGVVHSGRSENTVGAHVKGHNSGSIGICLSGRTGFTADQFRSLEGLLKDICTRHGLGKEDVLSHKDLDPHKTCPNFDVHELVSKYNWH
jgi:N-acetyl-anhydromuramyl-L-alanine amidase AmpD